MNYAFQFSGPVTALRAGTRAKSKSSHGPVIPTPNKLVLTGNIPHSLAGVELSSINSLPDIMVSTLINKLLIITKRNFSKANMSLSHLPLELLGSILANTFPDEWNHYNGKLEVLNLRTVCRKYLRRVFESFR